MSGIPAAIAQDFAKARRLEWWTLAWMSSVIAVMYATMGASKAMQSAVIEDVLSLVPAITWLIAAKLEPRAATAKYPYGLARVNGLAFLVSAVALLMVGAFLLYESAMTLLSAEHPTVPPVELFGQDVWLGWLMIAALLYSVVPPIILGRMKQPVARRLHDKVLHTDALMQKADWQTGLAGVLGITGIAYGLWWADSAAAAFISLSILHDGLTNIRTAAAELLDSVPRGLEGPEIADDARRLHDRLQAHWPQGHVRLRESGRYILANVGNVEHPGELPPLERWMGDDDGWRLAQLAFTPPGAASSDGPSEAP